MQQHPGWTEVESVVYCPGSWFFLLIGGFFALFGSIGFVEFTPPPGAQVWTAKTITAMFAILGSPLLLVGLLRIAFPACIRHADPTALPHVPPEPVIRQGSVVHVRLTHEIVENASGWEFRPAERLWRNDRQFFLGFGAAFLAGFSALLAWLVHRDGNFGWAMSTVCAILLTLVCGGSAFLLLGMMVRAGYKRLSRLTIPRSGDSLELDEVDEPEVENADLLEGLQWVFLGNSKRHQLSIPHALIVAVQLCPWKFVVGHESTWAVQGLLVFESNSDTECRRVPILLTSDFVRAARLMQKLALVLNVPYLFCADAAGWEVSFR